MTARSANRTRRRLRALVVGMGAAGVVAMAYAWWAAYLALMADEGPLPPRSRLPEVPAGARVVSETEECGSGGCWRELVVRPAAGQSPDELATSMGVADEQRQAWRILDPHSVLVGSSVVDGDVRVYVRY